MALRRVNVAIKFTDEEAELLRRRATEAGLKLRPYLRREILRDNALPLSTKVLLSQGGRAAEFALRVWEAASRNNLLPDRVRQIAEEVAAIDERVFLAQAGSAR